LQTGACSFARLPRIFLFPCIERETVSPTEAKESTRREIAVEVPADEVSRQTDALVQKYQKLARIPGFRKGHVPPSIIRQRFAEDIKTEVVEALVPRYFRQEAQKQGLTPVSQPRSD
jgi:trigger factor